MRSVDPPKQLNDAGKALWRSLCREYSIGDAGGLALLTVACEALDRADGARSRIENDGAFVPDRFGQLRAHPAIAVERDARGQLLQALKQLNLDLEPLRESRGRPADGNALGMLGAA